MDRSALVIVSLLTVAIGLVIFNIGYIGLKRLRARAVSAPQKYLLHATLNERRRQQSRHQVVAGCITVALSLCVFVYATTMPSDEHMSRGELQYIATKRLPTMVEVEGELRSAGCNVQDLWTVRDGSTRFDSVEDFSKWRRWRGSDPGFILQLNIQQSDLDSYQQLGEFGDCLFIARIGFYEQKDLDLASDLGLGVMGSKWRASLYYDVKGRVIAWDIPEIADYSE